ncbi:putative phage protein [Candidatus Hepatincola sp. Pdp]
MKNGLTWLIHAFGANKGSKIAASWKSIFNIQDESSRQVLQDLAAYCNMYNSSFVVNDSHHTAFNEGARDVFLHILEMANLTLEDILIINSHSLKED